MVVKIGYVGACLTGFEGLHAAGWWSCVCWCS